MKQMNDNFADQSTAAALQESRTGRKAFSPRKTFGIKLQLLIGFFLFTVVIVIVLWVFQIVLLNPFYEAIKISEVKAAAEQLAGHLEDEDALDEAAQQFARDYGISVRITNEIGNPVITGYYQNEFRATNIFMLDRFDLMSWYNRVAAGDGTYMEINSSQHKGGRGVIIYLSVVQNPNGINRLILLETEVTPVDSTVDTLKVQLTWLTALMIVLGIGLALYIANRISKPIVSINKSAKVLATGNYNIRFEEAGSTETTELGQTLNYAAVELSKVESLRRELLANVSHDLRTPLTMIKGYSEVMRDLPGENTPENAQILIDEASRLTDLVNDMLDLSKLEAGAISLETERYNLTESLREILNRYDRLADFSFALEADEDIHVRADELKISQVVYNLLNNAINYSLDDKTITLRQVKTGGHVRIEVIDHGEGIPGDKLKDIWDRYYKIDKEHKRAQIGTGLGLSIVKNILDMHGGTYGVQSKTGVGSTFWFELPLDASAGKQETVPELPETHLL